MYRISIPALVIAFFAELAVDWVINLCMFIFFAGDALTGDMTNEAVQQVYETVGKVPAYTFLSVVFGSATVVGGGYLAARIARKFPYYHGLGMAILGIAYTLYLWRAAPLWLSLLSLFSNIPLSIWGAHLATRHMPPPE